MNGPAVSPGQKSENAPTWQSRKHFFDPPKSVFFGPQNSIPNPQFIFLGLLFSFLSCRIKIKHTQSLNR